MLILSIQGFSIEVLSILGDVLPQLVKSISQSIPLRNQYVINHISTIEDIYLYSCLIIYLSRHPQYQSRPSKHLCYAHQCVC